MASVYVNICLIIFIAILLWPQPVNKTVRKIVPFLLVVISVFACSVVLQKTTERTITITALNQTNDAAQGNEIWLKTVIVNGEEKSAKDVFSQGWIDEDGYLKWRSYDQIEGMKSSISAKFDIEDKIELVFDSNKWRGKAEIKDGFKVMTVDCFQELETGYITYDLGEMEWSFRVPGKVVFIFISSFLCIVAAIFILFSRTKPVDKTLEIKNNLVKKREIWLDVLKIVSAFMVVLIHTVGPAYQTLPIDSKEWLLVLFLNALPRFAVPVFMMVSGILVLDKEISFEQTKKKVAHGLVLLFAWNIVYIFLQAILWGSSESIIEQILCLPVKSGPSGHLWYTYFIVWFYIFSPILGVMYRALTMQQRIYFAAFATIIPSLLDLYSKSVLNSSGILSSTSLLISLNYIGIVFMGRIVYDLRDKVPNLLKISPLLILFGLIGMILSAYYSAIKHNIVTDNFFMEIHFFPVIYALGVLLVAAKISKSSFELPYILKKFVTKLSIYSLGIYFVHCVVIWTLGDIEFYNIIIPQNGTALTVICCCVVYYVISVIWIYLMSKIPVVKKLIT